MANIKKYYIPTAAFVLGLGGGFAVGYLTTRNRLANQYAAEAAEMIHADRQRVLEEVQASDIQVQSEFENFHVRRDFIQAVIAAGHEAPDAEGLDMLLENGVDSDQYIRLLDARKAEMNTIEVEEEKDVLLFEAVAETGDQYEYESYCETRDETEPHLIHISEFMESDDRTKITLRYYVGDDTLVDNANKEIPDVRNLLGEIALENFGRFSQDNNIVYVRNPHQDADFEVIKDPATWVEATFGVAPEDTRPKVGKMREDD